MQVNMKDCLPGSRVTIHDGTVACISNPLLSGNFFCRSRGDVNQGFREILELSQQCRFANCVHLREPGCAVKNAVDDGKISPRRYESYKRLMSTSQKLAEKFS